MPVNPPNFIRRRPQQPGQVYGGPAAYVDADEGGVLGILPGFYALDQDGKRLNPRLRLVCVDDAPGDAGDGSCHYVIAGKGDPVQAPAGERFIRLEAQMEGRAEVGT